MEKIQQTTLLMEHIKKSHMQDVFSFDVSTIAELFSFQPQEFLIEVGHNSDYLYFLTSGEIMVCTYTISEKFHSQCYYHGLAPILGEASILWGKTPISAVQALTKGTCVGISVKKHGEQLLNDNHFLRYVCQILSERLHSSNFITSLDPVEVRFASFLITNSQDNVFSFKISTCAELLDTSYRHLFRVINKLCAANILQKTKKGYLILDRQALDQLSQGKLEIDF